MNTIQPFRDTAARNNPGPEQQMAENPVDRLSELPNSLLIHILSFLNIKEAAVTGLLSKRYQFIWADLRKLEFWGTQNADPQETRRFVDWIKTVLTVRTAKTLNTFGLRINYTKRYASTINSWLDFAAKSKVEKLVLFIHSNKYPYKLPNSIYSCSSVEFLMIEGRVLMDTKRKIEWRCLREVYLEEVEMSQRLVDRIGTECPVLSRFEMRNCWGFSRLEVKSTSVDRLSVEDMVAYGVPALEISAPYVRCLDISLYPHGRLLRLGDIGSVVKARVNFGEHDWLPQEVEVMSYTMELMQRMQHVKELELESKCFEVISIMAVTGLPLPRLRVCRLEVSSSSGYILNISGILTLLESSPDLEMLILEGYDTDGRYVIPYLGAKGDLDCDLSRLKTIYIRNFGDPIGQPMLTLARILLMRAKILESMEVMIDVEDPNDFFRIRQELLLYPKASRNAQLLINSSFNRSCISSSNNASLH